MEQKKQEIKVELSPEVAKGNYCNLAMIAHSGSEFFLVHNRGTQHATGHVCRHV